MSDLSEIASFEPAPSVDPMHSLKIETCSALKKFVEDNPVGRFSKNTSDAELYRLVKHMIDNCDLAAYDELIRKHTCPEQGAPVNKLKYLELIRCLRGRMNIALAMSLHKSMPLRILDIGTGAGHFPFIAKYFGHQVLTTDIPDGSPEGNLKNGVIEQTCFTETFYGDLLNFFELPRNVYRVEPFVPTPKLDSKFDLITSLSPSFTKYTDTKEVWGLEEWKFFLDDLRENVLTPDGRMFFWLTSNRSYQGPQIPDTEFVEFIESQGGLVNSKRYVIMFGQF